MDEESPDPNKYYKMALICIDRNDFYNTAQYMKRAARLGHNEAMEWVLHNDPDKIIEAENLYKFGLMYSEGEFIESLALPKMRAAAKMGHKKAIEWVKSNFPGENIFDNSGSEPSEGLIGVTKQYEASFTDKKETPTSISTSSRPKEEKSKKPRLKDNVTVTHQKKAGNEKIKVSQNTFHNKQVDFQKIYGSDCKDLLQNPFHILTASLRDNRRRIMELADERSLLLDSSECMEARSNLTNPRKRLSAEIAWLPGIGPKRVGEVLSILESSPTDLLFIDKLSSIARANLLAAGLVRVPDHNADGVAEWILEIAWAFEDIEPEELSMIINEERVVSGFPEVLDLSAVEAEIQERRGHYRQVIKSALDNISPKELVAAVTVAVGSATDDGEEQGPILIDDLVDSYEVEAQDFLEKEEANIKALVERLRTSVDAEQSDSTLAPIVNQLIQVVKNWDTVAQPIQVSKKSRGLDHDASHRVAGLVRGLAIHMFNEHGKLDFSQQLTNMLQEVFAEVGEVAERTAEDADALGEIAEQRVLHSEISRIEELTTQIKADIDGRRPDFYLSPKIGQLCQFVMNWGIEPEHDASQHAAWLVRDLAIHIFNKYDKLDFAQQLTKSLLEVFEDAGEISKRIADDAKALQEIALNRSKLFPQFKEFNLNGNSFSYKNETYQIDDIRHIGFYRAVTTHKTNFIKTGETEKANIYLTMSGGQEVKITVDEQGFFFKKDKSAQIKTVVEFYSYLSHVTFDRRVEFYESQIRRDSYFEYDKCYFYPRDKIVFRGRDFGLSSTSFLRGYGYVEMRKKDFGLLDKIKREASFTKIPQFSTIIDTDVIFHLLKKHFSLSWQT